MKKILLLTASVIIGTGAMAQPWLESIGNKPVKLQDIVNRYEEELLNGENLGSVDIEENESIKEGDDYHFRRWVHYWERHTDANGYIVPTYKKLQEFQKREARKKTSGAAAKTTSNSSNWQFEGLDKTPGGYNGIGRINHVAFHPTNPNTFWIASAGGGAWKTEDGGITWSAINDYFPVLGTSDIDFNPLNPNTVYICTGDRDGSDTYSVGVLKSTDGGLTWDTTGMQWQTTNFMLANSLVINPVDTNSLTLGTSNGIYKSYDGGNTWLQTGSGHVKQIVYNPVDTNILSAATYRPGSNGGAEILVSDDGGATWSQAEVFQGSRVALAVTDADPAIVKAIASKTDNGLLGIYNSTDSGHSYTLLFDDNNCDDNILNVRPQGDRCGGQAWYDLTIAISPTNANLVVAGGVNTWISTDGGSTWSIENQWTSSLPGVTVAHADKHGHFFHPLKPTELYECNDGGIYKANNLTSNGIWTDLSNGLQITQFYRLAVSNNAPFIIAGAQDNGSKMIQNGTYSELTGGDGMDCQMDPVSNSIFYTSIQYGELRRTTNGGGNFTDIQRNIPGRPQGAWVTPFLLHPGNPSYIIAGYKEVFYSANRGDSWTSISPDFGNNIHRLALSNTNSDYIYAIVNNRVQKTVDFGANWNMIVSTPIGVPYDIRVDPKDEEHIWVVYRGYTTPKVAEYSPTMGWVQHNDSLLPDVPVNCIEIDSSNGTVYIGTDLGVYYMDSNSKHWQEFNNNLPNVEVNDLAINYTSGEIWAATYGRGAWRSPKHIPDSATSIMNSIPLSATNVKVYPNPNYGTFELQVDNQHLIGQKVTIQLVNITGQVAWQKDVKIDATGKNTINADVAQGSYIFTVKQNGLLYAKEKVVIY